MHRSALLWAMMLLICDSLAAQQTKSNPAGYDKIITFDREVFVGTVDNITFADVRYISADDKSVHLIARSRISQILYAGGRRDVFLPLDDPNVHQKELVDTGKIIVKNLSDWMKVRVTEDPDEVNNLLAMGVVKTRYEGEKGNIGNEELMRLASVNLKKKAAAMRAHYVLVETKFFNKNYGELPVVEVTGRVFGYR